MTAPSRSIFGPLLVIGLGVVLLANNLLDDYSLWTPLLDHWPWILVVWGGIHVAQHLLARANEAPGPPRLGAGAVVLALLVCLAGSAGRWIRANDGVVFREAWACACNCATRPSGRPRLPRRPLPKLRTNLRNLPVRARASCCGRHTRVFAGRTRNDAEDLAENTHLPSVACWLSPMS